MTYRHGPSQKGVRKRKAEGLPAAQCKVVFLKRVAACTESPNEAREKVRARDLLIRIAQLPCIEYVKDIGRLKFKQQVPAARKEDLENSVGLSLRGRDKESHRRRAIALMVVASTADSGPQQERHLREQYRTGGASVLPQPRLRIERTWREENGDGSPGL